MRKTIVIMSPTVNRANLEWKAFLSRWSIIIKKANRTNRYIELLNGQEIYFKGETEGQRMLLGLHADIVSVDEFVMPKAESEEISDTNLKMWEGIFKAEKECGDKANSRKDEFPFVTPQPNTGRWIDDKCSVCGKGIEDLIVSPEWYRDEEPNFCPFCGLKLVKSQESEERNE